MRIGTFSQSLIALFLFSGASLAQPQDPPLSGPDDAWYGCEDVALPQSDDDGGVADLKRNRVSGDREIQTKTRTRILQGQPIDSAEITADAANNASCWSRLDGVWREDKIILLDKSVDPESWAGGTPSMRALAHGTYTTPRFLIVANGDEMEGELIITDAFDAETTSIFASDDGVALEEVLKRGGKRKTYKAREKNAFGETLTIDVSRSGFIRLRIDNAVFKRPSPGITSAAMEKQYAMDELFLFPFNMENMIASRKGYDITKQDPFRILRNDRAEVFEEVYGKRYRLLERRTVPLGFHLVQEIDQGMVYTRTSSSSEREIQDKNRWSYGGKARIGKAADVTGAHPSLSVGVDFVRETANTMRSSNMASQAVGYSRTKQYALVLDHPYIQLHPDFIDAVEDARRYGDDEPKMYDRIIDKFGTHYPYAVTYGANAKMTFSYSEQETYRRRDRFESDGASVEAEAVYAAVEAYVQNERTNGSGSGSGSSDEKSTFEAVGGNGSWDEKGYAAGQTPYPILLDLRPIDELLNPMNFPGEEDVTGKVRDKLASRIANYMSLRAAGLSDWPIVDTTLNGQYVSDQFPDMMLSFSRNDYARSTLKITGLDGRSFAELMSSRIKEGTHKPLPQLAHAMEDLRIDFAKIYSREGHHFRRPYSLKRTAEGGYGYGAKVMNIPRGEIFRALEVGVVDPEWFDFISIQGLVNEKSRWHPQFDGSLHLNVYPDAKPIKFQRVSADAVAAQKRPALTGFFSAEEWPDHYFSFVETDYGTTRGAIFSSDGRFFLAPDEAEIDRLTASGVTREDIRKNLEEPIPFELVRLSPEVADYRHIRGERNMKKRISANADRKRKYEALSFGERIPLETATWHVAGEDEVILKFNDDKGTEIRLRRNGSQAPVRSFIVWEG